MQRFHVITVGKLGKGLSVKREKQPDDTEVIVAHLKFSEMILQREHISLLCGQDELWADRSLYDDLGAPRLRCILSLPYLRVCVTGIIAGNSEDGVLHHQADLAGVEIALVDKGAVLSGELVWKAAGDEISDVESLLGHLCRFEWTFWDSGQRDLFKPDQVAA